MKTPWTAFMFLSVVAICHGGSPLSVKADPSWRFGDDGTLLFRYHDSGVEYAFYGALASATKERPAATAFFILPADLLDAKVVIPRLKPADEKLKRPTVPALLISGAEIDIPDARIYRIVRWEGGLLVRAVSYPIVSDISRTEILRMLEEILGRRIEEEPIQPAQPTPGS